MAVEFWIDDSGQNVLKGVEHDPCNPILLQADVILYALVHDPQAAPSFDRLFPAMLPEEKCRLEPIRYSSKLGLEEDDITQLDIFMRGYNTAGVRRGGGWIPPPFGSY